MTWAYLHLISHSFPIVLFVTGALVGIAGWIAGRAELERWGLLAFLVGGVFVVPAYLTGLAAADVVADRTFVRPSAIQRHRTWATFAVVPLLSAAILAGFSFAEPEDRRLRRFVLLLGAGAAALTGFAATLGARIEHGEEKREEARSPAGVYRVATASPKADHLRLDERIGSDVRQLPDALDPRTPPAVAVARDDARGGAAARAPAPGLRGD